MASALCLRNDLGRWVLAGAALRLAIAAVPAPDIAIAGEVQMLPAKDNTLFDVPGGAISNGAGPHIFVGQTSATEGRSLRRALLQFDVAAAVPFGVRVDSVQLLLRLTRSVDTEPRTLRAHRVLADWGEAGSNSGGDAAGGGGRGAPAEPGDATWTHRFWDTAPWAAPGGDFAAAPSATADVGGASAVGTTIVWSSAGLAADVQAWLDEPSANLGWIVIGDEMQPLPEATTRRFGSRDNGTIGLRPVLVVSFTITAVEPRTWSSVKALLR